MQKTLVAFLAFLSCASLNAQTTVQIDTLETRYQACLDKGDNMLSCTSNYYWQMDSMLNAVYKNIMSRLDTTKKQQLRITQRKWLIKRDKEFKKIEKDFKESSEYPGHMAGEDQDMFIINGKAKVVNERIRELIQSFHSILSP